MGAMMEDKRPLARAMQSYHLMDVDTTSSQASLNIQEDNGRQYRAENPGVFGISWRTVFLIVSIIFFTLSLVLFIGTIVAYYNRPSEHHDVVSDKQSQDLKPPSSSPASKAEGGGPADAESRWTDEQWSVTTVNDRHVHPGKLIWSEEFETFNRSSWFHLSGDSDNHFYFNVNNASNSFAKDGKLFLKPSYSEDRFGKAYIENGTLLLGIIPAEKCLNESSILCWKGSSPIVHPIMAPMISSTNFFKFKYGKLQISAKMPSGDWIEPIMSLQPDKSFYGDDLRSGQIHFVDTRGNRKLFNADGVNIGTEQNCPDIRYGNKEAKKILYYCLNTNEDEGFDRDFHLYELEWTPESILLKVDGEGVVGGPYPRPSMYKLWNKGRSTGANPWYNAENTKMAPFDRSFHLTIGLSIGGTSFFQDDFENRPYPKPWNNSDINAPKTFWDARHLWEPTWANDRSAMQIDYIRFYSLNETILSGSSD